MCKQVTLEKSDLDLVKQYTKENWSFFKAHGRDKETIIRDVYEGKLGELAFYKLFKDKVSKIDLENRGTCDEGYDFKSLDTGIKIDIKVLRKSHFSKVFFNSNYMHSDYYCAIRVLEKNKDFRIYEIIGYCSHDDAKKFKKSGSSYGESIYTTYIPLGYFNDIEI